VAGAGAAFETMQLQLLNVLQQARNSLAEAEQEKARLQSEIDALAKEKQDLSQRAQKAEATLGRANEVLQTQQGVLEKALLREREAVQRAYMLELRLRQGGGASRAV
jgi:peptidoglycan hydrolase CwlO-like protein